MVEQLCPQCREGNPLDNQFCGRCGADLQQPLAERPPSDLTIGRGRLLADPALRQLGRTVAMSLAALATEAGLSWLRRRIEGADRVPQAAPQTKSTALARPNPAGRHVTTIVGQRVISFWRHGRLTGQTIEQSVWQIEESSGDPLGM